MDNVPVIYSICYRQKKQNVAYESALQIHWFLKLKNTEAGNKKFIR